MPVFSQRGGAAGQLPENGPLSGRHAKSKQSEGGGTVAMEVPGCDMGVAGVWSRLGCS